MSTRATYKFEATRWQPATTVYIHHDAYPEYAFNYFLNASNRIAEGLTSGFAEAFIGANEGAQITSNHVAHGDTDYRYTFNRGKLKVKKRVDGMMGGAPIEYWRTVYDGTVTDFINKYRGAE
tara:strand:- start:3039 stop:3404 length:366 start_codon:yes stop_codon:yes gene_type:complete